MKVRGDKLGASRDIPVRERSAEGRRNSLQDRNGRILSGVLEYGILGLIIFSPLPAASVYGWSILTIQLAVLLMAVAYFLKPSIHRPNESLRRAAQWPRLLAFGFFAFILFQIAPLPTFLVRILSPQTYLARMQYGAAPPMPRLLSLSLIPSETLRAASELLAYFLLGFLILRTVRSIRQIRRLIGTMIAMGIFQAFYGMYELYNKNPRILFFKKVHNLDSVTGTFVNRNHFSGYLEMIIPLALGLIMARIDFFPMLELKGRKRFLAIVEKGLLGNLLLALGTVAMAVAIVFSNSRSGIFILVFMFILFIGFSVFLREQAAEEVLWIRRIFRALFIVVLCCSFYIGIGSTIRRFSLDALIQDGRPTFWAQTIQWIGRFPVFGTGLGTFPHLYPGSETEGIPIHIYHAHNDYLEYLMEVGALGFLLLAGTALVMLWQSFKVWRTRRNPEIKGLALGGFVSCLSIIVHSLTDFNMQIPANILLFSTILSLTMVVSFHRKKDRSQSQEKRIS